VRTAPADNGRWTWQEAIEQCGGANYPAEETRAHTDRLLREADAEIERLCAATTDNHGVEEEVWLSEQLEARLGDVEYLAEADAERVARLERHHRGLVERVNELTAHVIKLGETASRPRPRRRWRWR
jgi:hypothetical protein